MNNDKKYYYFAEVSKDLLSIKRPASKEEISNLDPCIKKVSLVLMDNKRVDTVTSLYSKLIGTINACSEEENVININDVQSMLSQYLFEFRKFLDNWETEIKRRYGKTSSEFEILKNARSNEYDTHMEYRIMYQLRNYDQHCGNILARAQGKVDEHENKHYIFSMKRDLLLENYNGQPC